MQKKEWEQRLRALRARYTLTPRQHAALKEDEMPDLRHLEHLLAGAFSYTTSEDLTDLSPDNLEATLRGLDLDHPYVKARALRAAQRHSSEHPMDAASDLWDLFVTARCAQLAFAAGIVPPVIEVEDALQYQLLTMEPPARVTREELVIPMEGFAISIPHEALTASGAFQRGDVRAGTHGFVCPSPFRRLSADDTSLNMLLLLPYKRPGDETRSMVLPVPGSALEAYPDREVSDLASLLRRYVLNALLFVGAEGATLGLRSAQRLAALTALHPRKRRQHHSELKALHADKALVLSTECEIDPEIKQFVLEGGLCSPTHTLKHRTMVRGHWRNQACGEGRKDRKRIAIQAHFRGPTLEEQMGAVVHTYHVKAPKP